MQYFVKTRLRDFEYDADRASEKGSGSVQNPNIRG